MDMTFIFVAGGLFLLGIMVYLIFMIFLPEWVGITGKKALEAERSHAGDSEVKEPGPASDVLNRMESLPDGSSSDPTKTKN